MTIKLFKELMDKYTQNREKWILKNGTDEGFDDWFTDQVEDAE